MINCLKIFVFLLLTCVSLSAQQLNHVQGEVLVCLPEGVEITQFSEALEEFNGKQTQIQLKSQVSQHARIWLYTFDNQIVDEYEFLAFLKDHPLITTAQFNHWTTHRNTPDDLFYGLQWHWNNTGQSEGLTGADIAAEAAWDITTGGVTAQGDTIVIAVIDDGIDLEHPDLQPNLWVNHGEIPFNDHDDDENGYVDDYRGYNVYSELDNQGIGSHGTSVAGVAGAVGNNGLDIAGVNWDVKIMSILAAGGTEAEIISGYDYALSQRLIYNSTNGEFGAFVVATNTSFGIDQGNPDEAPLWCDFFDLLGNFGILSVAATSNDNVNVDEVGDLPTTCSSPYLISVTATDHNDERVSAAYGVENVDLAAPGTNVWTLAQGGGVGLRSGTSFAAPAVTGLVALLYSLPCAHLGTIALNEPITAAEIVRDLVYAGVENIPSLAGEVGSGGRINAGLSLQIALDLCQPCTPAVTSNETILSPIEVSIDFLDFDSDSTDIFWKRSDEDMWLSAQNVSYPVLFSDLDTCTAYDYYFVSNCLGNQVTSSVHSTQTNGCCLPPTDVQYELVNELNAVINWSSDAYNSGYFYRYRVGLGDNWIAGNEEITAPFIFTDALPCNLIEFQLGVLCEGEGITYSNSTFILTGGCGTCTDASYCTMQGFSSSGEYIESILIEDFLMSSGNNEGYGDFTGHSIELVVGEEVSFSLIPGFPFIPYEESWAIWIDINHDGTFDSATETMWESSTPNAEIEAGTFVLPTNIMEGSTRMRIAMTYAGDGEVLYPCIPFPYGEVEDYCVFIYGDTTTGGNNSCILPDTFTNEIITENAVLIDWEDNLNIDSFKVFLQATNLSYSTEMVVVDSEVLLEDLEECEDYNLYVKSFCPFGGVSDYTTAFTFSSSCMTSNIEDATNSDNIIIFPNPTSDIFEISLPDTFTEPIHLSLFAADGKCVFKERKDVITGDNKLIISDLVSESAGIYFLKIQSKNTSQTLKIVKE